MPRRVKEEAERTRSRIIASALSLFAKKGYDHTTFTDIAARLKMTKGAVYWHFESKEALLSHILDEMHGKFQKLLGDLLPQSGKKVGDLSFPDVADVMVRLAMRTVSDAKYQAFFLLLHEQIHWSSASMDKVRNNILKNRRGGPWDAFFTAVSNDIKASRARSTVDPAQIASCCQALWNGLVHSHIAQFITCDLEDTLRNAYNAIWRDISVTK